MFVSQYDTAINIMLTYFKVYLSPDLRHDFSRPTSPPIPRGSALSPSKAEDHPRNGNVRLMQVVATTEVEKKISVVHQLRRIHPLRQEHPMAQERYGMMRW